MNRLKVAVVAVLVWGTIIAVVLGVLYLAGGSGDAPDNCVHPGGAEYC